MLAQVCAEFSTSAQITFSIHRKRCEVLLLVLLVTDIPTINKQVRWISFCATHNDRKCVNLVRSTDVCIFMYTDTAKSLMLKFKILFCLNKI